MTKNKNLKWILASLGLLSAAFSVVMLFSTTVLAACNAVAVNCPEIKCEIKGAGTCSSTANCVTCYKEGDTSPLPMCCYGGGGDY